MPASSLCYNAGMNTKIIVGAAVSAVLALSAFADRPWVVINFDLSKSIKPGENTFEFAAPVKANVRELTVE